jgi:hypothetical protein
MKAVIMLLIFSGMFVIIHSIYEEKLRKANENVRIEYKFIPRTMYEEQMQQSDILSNFKGMFNKASPWYNSPNTYDLRPLKEDDKEKKEKDTTT